MALLVKIGADLSNLEKQIKKATKDIRYVGDKMAETGKSLTTAVTLPIIGVGTAAGVASLQFSDAMAKVGTIADQTAKPLGDLKKEVIELSNETGQSANDIAEGMYQAISAGIKTADSAEFLKVALKAAKGGFTDTTTAVDGLTNVLNTYGMSADEAETIANQMLVAQNKGKTTFGELAEAIGRVAPTAASMNISTQELFSSLASLTANGIQTSEAVTGLKAAYSNIIKPSKEAAETAEKLGLKFDAAHIQSVGWSKFLEEVKQKAGGNTETMAKLFGSVEALNSVLVLTSDNGMALMNSTMHEMQTNSTALDSAVNQMNESAGVKFQKALNQMKNSLIVLGDALEPIIMKIAQFISWIAGWIAKFGELDAITKTVIIAIGTFLAALGPLLVIVGTAISLFGTLTATATALGIGIGALVAPVALAVAAIAGIIAIGVTLYKNWDTIVVKAREMGNVIFEVFKGIGQAIKGFINGIISGVNQLIKGLNKISFSLPSWVPGIGGKSFSINIPQIPMLATGTNYVPKDMLAMIHKGEAVVPKKYNPNFGGSNGGNIIQVILEGRVVQEYSDNALGRRVATRAGV